MEEKLRRLWAEARELNLGTSGGVDRLDSPPCPLRFLRDYVSANKPCLISRSATLHWPAISQSLWEDDAYLCRALRGRTVSVHLTPDGRADALALAPLPGPGPGPGTGSGGQQLCFASACVRPMPFPEALRLIIDSPSPSGSGSGSGVVAYAQQQNDCFRAEYSALADDVEPHIPWATEAIGCLPEAVNLWIGSARSETSFHKDHYENLYAVVTGEKHFLLLPPTDLHRLYVRPYPAARYITTTTTTTEGTGGELKLELELELEEPERQVPWCSVDPYPHSHEAMEKQRSSFPLYFDGPRPFECTVKAGEILYLPSMWFHHVRQTPNRSGRTIAINYWYDMQFDIKYAYFNLLQSIEYPLDSDPSGKACKHGIDDSRSQISMSDSMHDVESESLEERVDSTNS